MKAVSSGIMTRKKVSDANVGPACHGFLSPRLAVHGPSPVAAVGVLSQN